MKRIDKIILYSVFYTPVILLFSYLLLTGIFGKSTHELIKEDDFNQAFFGEVDSLYVEKQNHGVKTALLSTGYKYQIVVQWEHQIELGDSLAKQKKSFLVHVYKKSGRVIILDYRKTYKKE